MVVLITRVPTAGKERRRDRRLGKTEGVGAEKERPMSEVRESGLTRTSLTKEMLEMVPSGKDGQLVLRNGATAHWSGGFEVWMARALEWRTQNLG